MAVVHGPEGPPSGWPDVAAVAPVGLERELGGERTVTGPRSIGSRDGTAAGFAGRVRGRWGIGDGLHRVLGVVLREGRSRIRAKNARADLARIRRVAVSLPRGAPGQGGGAARRLEAGRDDRDLQQVLQGIPASIVR